MVELMQLPFAVSTRRHRVLGKQVVVQFATNFILKLTLTEASSLSFALVAVRDGVSEEQEIYMSPIASDGAFVGLVQESGMSISTPTGALELDWEHIGELAGAIAKAID